MEIEVLKIGSTVFVGEHKDIPARIQRVTLSITGVTYEVGWWSGNEFKEKWLYREDFITDKLNTVKIGFLDA